MPKLRIPAATYRLQFNGEFRFADAQALVDYLHQLGITDIYASPLLQARRGSAHGYDVTDPSHLNVEIGTERELESLSEALRQKDMGLLLDIVPNHMAASSENPWWMDVLEDGPGSAYAAFFDIDWHPPRTILNNRVLLPILGRPYAETLENKELKLVFEQGSFFVLYYETKLPAAPKSYARILQHRLDELQEKMGAENPAFRELGGILAAIASLPERTSLPVELAGERRLQREAIKERLRNLVQNSADIRRFVEQNLRIFNGRKHEPGSFVPLDRLLGEQAYVLSYWLSVTEEINYRRFFTITDLVGVRTEDPLVFEATHSVILRLAENGIVTGLRIDHIDGLRDPAGYLRRLQEHFGLDPGASTHPRFYVIAEKILAEDERVPPEWPICGTTGYDFVNVLNGVFVEPSGATKMGAIYKAFTGEAVEYSDLVYAKKIEVMETLLAVEMRSLGHHLGLLAEQDRYARDLPLTHLAAALTIVTACLPVYRTYIRNFLISASDRRRVEQALACARTRNPGVSSRCFDFIEDVLLLRERPHITPEQREARLAFIVRWQQFTGPIMAKGFEDSALYIYNRLVSLNEVGGNPDSRGVTPEEFHLFCRRRQKNYRHTLNATSTHDTKRSEDVRARINVLSEMPEKWEKWLNRWARLNKPKKKLVNNKPVPDPNEEVLLYQTMLGAWPLDEREVPAFRLRLQEYMVKATREAMVHTKWTRPNVEHEEALSEFVKEINENSESNRPFLSDFLIAQAEIAFYGALNSLSQQVIKITAPGVPDFYQGTELWALWLVDPDNRRPVDFAKYASALERLRKAEADDRPGLLRELVDTWCDGRIKLYITAKALDFRRANAELFRDGAYEPLDVSGSAGKNVCAFLRHAKRGWAITLVPRLTTKLVRSGHMPLGEKVWSSNVLRLPRKAPERWTNALTGEVLEATAADGGRVLPISAAFNYLPVALLSSGAR